MNDAAAEKESLRESIDRGWAVAAADFKRRTGLQLGDHNGGKDGVLGTLRSAYDENNEKMKKQDGLWQVVEKVLTGVEWVGSLASSIGGLFFPPAGACFSAIEKLINIPRLLKKLSDDLRKLFDRIMSFFSNLKILRRADAQLGLDGELVRKTNEILMCLVKVCAIAIHARDHKWSAITSNLFLGDDKMQAALDEFKTHCEDQNKLITTVTLEEAMQTRSVTKDVHGRTIVIEGQTREANEGIRDLRADNAHRKNMAATQDMVSQIQKEWRIREAETASPLQELGPCMAELLPGTFEALTNDGQFLLWSEEEAHSRLLYLCGDVGTGRTFFLAALARHVEEKRRALTESDPSIYLVYYAFKGADEAVTDKDNRKDTAMHTAVKIMACHLAQQSTTYAKLLFESYRSLHDRNLEDVWTKLRFEDFDAPDKSMLYLCFDGLDQLRNLKPLLDVLNTIVSNNRISNPDSKVKLRVILTGKDDMLNKKLLIPTINIEELNKPIIKQYVQNGMQEIVDVQDSDTLSSSNLLVDDILSSVQGSFSAANQRLKILDDAINEDLDFDEIRERITSQKITTLAQEGFQLLAETCEALKPHYREQLKEILYWSAFGALRPTLSTVQSSLFLQRQTRSLESLERKIRTRFSKVLSIRGDRIIINSEVEQYIRSVDSDLSPPSSSVGSPHDTIEPKSQFANQHDPADQLLVSTAEGQYTIIKRCLQAFNEDDPAVREKIQPVLDYASRWLLGHIRELKDSHISQLGFEQRRYIGQALIEFLSDEECIDLLWMESPIDSSFWLEDVVDVLALGELLMDRTILHELSPKNRRIARKLTNSLPGHPTPFLELLATRAAWHWLQRNLEPVREEDDDEKNRNRISRCYQFVNGYVNLIRSHPRLFDPESATAPNGNMGTGLSGVFDDQDEIGGNSGNSTGSSNENLDPNQVKKLDFSTLPGPEEAVRSIATESKNDDTGLGLKDEPTVTQLSSNEEVQRARDWAFEKLGLQENAQVLIRMGQVLVDEDDTAAIEYLQKASTSETGLSFDNTYVRIQTLATAYANQKNFADAHAVLTTIIDRLYARSNERPSSVQDKQRLATTTKQVAGYLVALQKEDEAIACLEEYLEQVAGIDSACLQELVRLLCKNKQFTKAEKVFDNWVTSSEGSADQSPASIFAKGSSDDIAGPSLLFFWTRGTSLHDRIVRILETAIADARKHKRIEELFFLLMTYGVAHAIIGKEERLQMALESWTQGISHYHNTEIADLYICVQSINLVLQSEFDLAVKKLRTQPQVPLNVRRAAFERLKSLTRSYFTPLQQFYDSFMYSSMVYPAVFARLAELTKEAKTLLNSDMEKALEILSNTDPYDDDMGIYILHRIMLLLGDVAGALSCWSFDDRAFLAAKRKDPSANPINGDSSKEITLDQGTRASRGSNDITDTDNGTNDTGESSDTTSISTNFRWGGGCNLCRESVWLDSRSEMEIWSCTYCPAMDFCRGCYEKIKSNQSERLMCSSEHVHVLMKHFDYDEEEVKGQNVRIDWQLVESNGGRDRQRIGGRIVTLDEWVQILRKEWDIPESKTEGRLQK